MKVVCLHLPSAFGFSAQSAFARCEWFLFDQMVLGIPVMSACVHAKMSALALSRFRNSFLRCLDWRAAMVWSSGRGRNLSFFYAALLLSKRNLCLYETISFVTGGEIISGDLSCLLPSQMCLCELLLLAKV
ncbi:hypothetical protein Tco_1533103 [Tanacetum coccineum]